MSIPRLPSARNDSPPTPKRLPARVFQLAGAIFQLENPIFQLSRYVFQLEKSVWQLEKPIFQLQKSIIQLPKTVFQLRNSIFQLNPSIFQLENSIFQLNHSVFQLEKPIFQLQKSVWQLEKSSFQVGCRRCRSADAPGNQFLLVGSGAFNTINPRARQPERSDHDHASRPVWHRPLRRCPLRPREFRRYENESTTPGAARFCQRP